MAKRTLGKGLGAIISSPTTKAPAAETEKVILSEKGDSVVELNIADIEPNPDQPRYTFNEEEIEHLAESIDSVGLIQPIIVRKTGEKYFIIAGERRYRASKLLEKSTIKAIIIKANEEQNLTLALIENIQRQDLDPIEEAKAYKLLISRFKLKQNEVAKRVGKERATVANAIRLLSLPENIQTAVSNGQISQGHAKILAGLDNNQKQYFFEQIIDKGISVRALEQLLKDSTAQAEAIKEKSAPKKEAHIKKMEDKLVSLLGTKVEIRHNNAGKGKIEISYYSLDDFERIVEKFE